MFKNIDRLPRMKRSESHATSTLRYARLQTWATVATAIMTGLITGAAAWIAYLQYQSTERQLLLDLARSRARYSAEVELRGRLGRGDSDVMLASMLHLKLTEGDFSATRFEVAEFVKVLGSGAYPGIPCVVQVAGYWGRAPSGLAFTLQPHVDFQRVINEGVHLPNGKAVYLTSARTEVTHHYLDVFQREAKDLVEIEEGSVRLRYGKAIKRPAPGPDVTAFLSDPSMRGESGFVLRIFEEVEDLRPLREKLPLECRRLLAD